MTPEERAAKIVAETRAWADAEGFQDACPSVETIADAIRAARADERDRLMGELQRIADHPGDFEVCEGCIDAILKYLRGEWKPIILTREQMDAVPLSALQAQQSEAMADAALRRVERAFGLVRDGDSPLP
jgi:hypothetical protein